jgi:hypothetical protein
VAAAAVVFLIVASGQITARFGDSDEGINGAVWAYNAASLRTDGVMASRLGGKRLDGTLYASHPPLIVVETAVTQALGGARPWSSRAPAWLGSLAALGLLYYLCLDAGFDPLVAGGAVALTGLTPMLITYGSMLDTPVTEFPFAIAVLICWYRDWRGERALSPYLVGALALLASLAGWQAAMLCGLCGLTFVARAVRRRPGALRQALPYLLGALVGIALSLGWAYWTYGSFHVLADKYLGRTGTSNGVGLGEMVSFQVPWLFALLALSVIGLIACCVALRDRRLRPLASMALASVFVYALVFRQAAAGHQYWNYWALLPAAVGWAYALDHLLAGLRRSSRSPWVPIGAVVVLVVLAGSFNLARPDKARDDISRGERAADLVATDRFPTSQRVLTYVGEPYRPDAWVVYATRFEPLPLTSAAQLDRLARSRPDDLVLILGVCPSDEVSYHFCLDATVPGAPSSAAAAAALPVRARLETAGALAAAVTGTGR